MANEGQSNKILQLWHAHDPIYISIFFSPDMVTQEQDEMIK